VNLIFLNQGVHVTIKNATAPTTFRRAPRALIIEAEPLKTFIYNIGKKIIFVKKILKIYKFYKNYNNIIYL